jgi:hypothetical protein
MKNNEGDECFHGGRTEFRASLDLMAGGWK